MSASRTTTMSMLVGALVLATVSLSHGQYGWDSVWVHAIYYDYKSDQSNPDFQPAGYFWKQYEGQFGNGLYLNVVEPTLGADRKPILNAAVPAANRCFNDHVSDWYRPSGNDGEMPAIFAFNTATRRWQWNGLKQRPGGRPNEWVGPYWNPSDSMANIVIYDSLLFTLSDYSTATYQFEGEHFFPLDSAGWGIEGQGKEWGHNFSFATEMHIRFTYRPGPHKPLSFSYTGDDDAWAFVNGKLVMDLGGIHGPLSGAINLDSLGLQPCTKYDFDFFRAERNVVESVTRITTNFLYTADANTRFAVLIDSVITAGTAHPVMAFRELDCTGNPVEHDPGSITWQLVNPEPGDSLIKATGDTAIVVAMKADRYLTIRLRYRDPGDSLLPELTAQRRTWVESGAAVGPTSGRGAPVDLRACQPHAAHIAAGARRAESIAVYGGRKGVFTMQGRAVRVNQSDPRAMGIRLPADGARADTGQR